MDKRFLESKLITDEEWEEYKKYNKIINKIKEIVDNEKITGIEAKLMIKDVLENKYE